MGEVLSLSDRQKADRIEAVIGDLPQVDLKTINTMAGGVFSRTIFIPAGTALVGTVHKKDHVNIVVGDISVTTDEGVKRITGYHVMPTKAGAKRVGFAHADTAWTTVCHTNLTDLDDIESELVENPESLQTRKPGIEQSVLLKLEK